MHVSLLIVPDWIGAPGEASLVRRSMPALHALAARGRVVRLEPPRGASVPEAAFLGLRDDEAVLAQGPLTVAALGADPPDRSVHFHLTVLSLTDTLQPLELRIPTEDRVEVLAAAQRLNTKRLTFVEGFDRDHGLVWEEGSIELGTVSPEEAAGKTLRDALPDGDGESMLRRYIDDSVNLLAELDFNRRRIDEELPPINVLWPWGHGFRTPVPNLVLRYGTPVWVESPSRRLQGLARLAGCRHGDPLAMGAGTNVRLERMLSSLEGRSPTVAVLPTIGEMRAAGRLEEAEWLSREIDTRLLAPLERRLQSEPARLLIASPGPNGLAIWVEHGPSAEGTAPFDERALEEKGLTWVELAEWVAQALGS